MQTFSIHGSLPLVTEAVSKRGSRPTECILWFSDRWRRECQRLFGSSIRLDVRPDGVRAIVLSLDA
jgi:hypothetical protein